MLSVSLSYNKFIVLTPLVRSFAKAVVSPSSTLRSLSDLAFNLLLLTGVQSMVEIPQRKMISKGSKIIIKELKEDCFKKVRE